MDCVSCERCRLWGKIQTTGVGTALKVLCLSSYDDRWETATFRRSEIIALFNTFGRLSESVRAMQKFRGVYRRLNRGSWWNMNTLCCATAVILSGIAAIVMYIKPSKTKA